MNDLDQRIEAHFEFQKAKDERELRELNLEYAAWFKDRMATVKADERRARRAWTVARIALALTLLAVPWSTGEGQVSLAPLFIPPSLWHTIVPQYIGGSVELPERPLISLLLGEWLGCLVLALVLGWRPFDQAREFIRTAQQFFNSRKASAQPVDPQATRVP